MNGFASIKRGLRLLAIALAVFLIIVLITMLYNNRLYYSHPLTDWVRDVGLLSRADVQLQAPASSQTDEGRALGFVQKMYLYAFTDVFGGTLRELREIPSYSFVEEGGDAPPLALRIEGVSTLLPYALKEARFTDELTASTVTATFVCSYYLETGMIGESYEKDGYALYEMKTKNFGLTQGTGERKNAGYALTLDYRHYKPAEALGGETLSEKGFIHIAYDEPAAFYEDIEAALRGKELYTGQNWRS